MSADPKESPDDDRQQAAADKESEPGEPVADGEAPLELKTSRSRHSQEETIYPDELLAQLTETDILGLEKFSRLLILKYRGRIRQGEDKDLLQEALVQALFYQREWSWGDFTTHLRWCMRSIARNWYDKDAKLADLSEKAVAGKFSTLSTDEAEENAMQVLEGLQLWLNKNDAEAAAALPLLRRDASPTEIMEKLQIDKKRYDNMRHRLRLKLIEFGRMLRGPQNKNDR